MCICRGACVLRFGVDECAGGRYSQSTTYAVDLLGLIAVTSCDYSFDYVYQCCHDCHDYDHYYH